MTVRCHRSYEGMTYLSLAHHDMLLCPNSSPAKSRIPSVLYCIHPTLHSLRCTALFYATLRYVAQQNSVPDTLEIAPETALASTTNPRRNGARNRAERPPESAAKRRPKQRPDGDRNQRPDGAQSSAPMAPKPGPQWRPNQRPDGARTSALIAPDTSPS